MHGETWQLDELSVRGSESSSDNAKRRKYNMELGVAIGLGLWFMVMGIAATVRVYKDFK